MESRKKKEAMRAKEIALEKMESKDFTSARIFALKAQQLCRDLDNIEQIIMVCDVHCSVGFEDEKDWYKILNVDPTANEASIRRQYNKMALTLHPDKNRFSGAAEAFNLVLEAKAMLTDNEKRRMYDSRCKAKALGNWNNWPNVRESKQNMMKGKNVQNAKKAKTWSVTAKVAVTKGKRKAKSAPKENEKRLKSYRIGPNSKNLDYLGGEFNDFEKQRSKKCFSRGQIWAVYDTLDAMPRFYALINDVVSRDFELHITWLEPLPNNEDEKKWLYQGLPASFGKFKLGQSETIEDHAIFSHLVMWKKSANLSDIYEIYPRKGEIWALFKKWDIDWFKHAERHKVYEFELVEILSDYYGEFGVNVAFLSKMEGFSSSFTRIVGKGVDWEVIQAKNRLRFSHKIPSFPATMNEGSNGVKNFFELDPASLPK